MAHQNRGLRVRIPPALPFSPLSTRGTGDEMKEWIKKTRDFLAETRVEMRKGSFPSRDEVTATTVVVLITSFVFAVFLWVSDIVIQRGYVAIVKVFSR